MEHGRQADYLVGVNLLNPRSDGSTVVSDLYALL